jgi:predicted NUDIX family NTP pyrophosphohydrolase
LRRKIVSAGCLVTLNAGREVLLVHPRAATFQRPVFGIPKGWVDEGENLAAAALRETLEETGLHVTIHASLGTALQSAGQKIVHAFWATVDPRSEIEVDEKGHCRGGDDENDVRKFYPIEQARQMMIPAQRVFLDRLADLDPK